MGLAQSVYCGIIDPVLNAAPADATTRYGRQVAVEQDVLVVSDYFSNRGVQVFRATDSGWLLEQVLERPAFAFAFGSKLTIDSGRIFVYDPFGWLPGSEPTDDVGSVFVYERVDDSWTMQHRIDLNPSPDSHVSDYGHDLDADGDHLLVSREGVSLFYHFNGTSWDRIRSTGTSTLLGASGSLDGDRAVIPRERPGTQNAMADVWEFSGGDWSVTMSYELPYDSANIFLELNWPYVAGRIRSAGGVWLHEFAGGAWVSRTIAPTGWSALGNNADLDFDSGYLLASSANNNEIIVFEREVPLPRWRIVDRFSGNDLGHPELGSSINSDGGFAAVGSLDNSSFLSFQLGCVPCPADLDGDLTHTMADVQFFIFAYQFGAPDADFDSNGVLNFFDIVAFLDTYIAGCP